jgi:mono/diheme cytochrome c family protein
MTRYVIAISLLCLPLAAATAQDEEGPPRWAANIARKQQVLMHGLPKPYDSLRDASPDSTIKLRRGAYLFERHCSSCHGSNGGGAGPDAFALVPAPADLEWLAGMPKSKADPYTYWAIAEGGDRFQSDMPAFKNTLRRNDIWSVVAYIRAGLPRRAP